jgi:hypothetical protein
MRILLSIFFVLFAGIAQANPLVLLSGGTPTTGGGSPETIDSYASSNQDTMNSIYSSDLNGVGQTITGTGSTLTSISFWLSRTGSPTGNATISVWAHTGTWGSTGLPTGSALATATLDVATVSTTAGMVSITFGSPYTLANGTHYVVTLVYQGGSSGNYIAMGSDASSPTHGGNMVYTANGTSWTAYANEDNIFTATHTP